MALPQLDEAEIFHAARQLNSSEARRQYLEQACGGDQERMGRIEALLRVHNEQPSFLETPAVELTSLAEPAREGPGAEIGPYKLLEQIGEGGFGLVFMAEQRHPIQRKVALKVLKPGMDTRQVIARFEAERQALALMDHPNIARVLDAGATTSGRPYFVMDLVNGMPITKYCDDHQLTPRERLALFVPICQALQHAHQKGIIHRDIKPSNVLVAAYDSKPVPKVIDFGVAKALGKQLTERTLVTAFGGIIGTLEYMSPEQAEFNALDVDTRADIYSLGVVLYELLTGTTPLTRQRLSHGAVTELLRLIREEEPPKPSVRLSESTQTLASISAQRKLDPTRLKKELRGDLDWIVMKALEKDRGRRYGTANDLARDIERHLADEPVEAGPPSAIYRLRKFGRKHRHWIGAIALFAFLLVVGTCVSLWQALRATAAQRQALAAQRSEAQQRQQAEAVLNFVEDHVFAAARPQHRGSGLSQDVTLRGALRAALPPIGTSFASQPRAEARVRTTLGTSFRYLGELQVALAQLSPARALYLEQLGPDHAATLQSATELATSYADLGQDAEALRLREDTVTRQKATLGLDHPDTLKSMRNLASSYAEAGRMDEAIKLEEETLALAKAKLGADDERTLAIMNNLALDYDGTRRYEDALTLQKETLAIQKVKLGPEHLDTLIAMNNLAKTYTNLHRYQEALGIRKSVLALQKAQLDVDHPEVLSSMYNLANTYGFLERYTEALDLHQQTLALRRAKFPPEHREVLYSMWGVAANLFKLGRGVEATPIIDLIITRAAGLKAQPDLVGLMDRQLEYFQKAKDSTGCRKTAEQWERLGRTDPRSLYSAACLRAAAAAIRAQDKSPEAPQQTRMEEEQAMVWLHKAMAAGYRDVAKLQHDPSFDTLRDRPDFRQLLVKMAGRKDKN